MSPLPRTSPVLNAATAILSAEGPIPFLDLANRLIDKGLLGGKTPTNTLYSMLWRQRHYELAEGGFRLYKVGRRLWVALDGADTGQ